MTAQDQAVIPLVIGRGQQAYVDAKRWIEAKYPNLTPEQYAQACRLAAKKAGV
ncbi:MAG: hypothetical protein KKE51_08970 [Gammaproteobacteria bacterium]|nr:hypothetical protein [Gammaproteobacteria bacterium]MBU1602523.1 hypothetical protein [Gammaproteobacteria bacterium]MBU2433328.1 hypothetical protein [Gammaproteobacteria bacterium]MBU2451244.1 hypothetical protein [Gammaproteobacteria bacterium]